MSTFDIKSTSVKNVIIYVNMLFFKAISQKCFETKIRIKLFIIGGKRYLFSFSALKLLYN